MKLTWNKLIIRIAFNSHLKSINNMMNQMKLWIIIKTALNLRIQITVWINHLMKIIYNVIIKREKRGGNMLE